MNLAWIQHHSDFNYCTKHCEKECAVVCFFHFWIEILTVLPKTWALPPTPNHQHKPPVFISIEFWTIIFFKGVENHQLGLIEGKSPEEIAAALKELPPDQLAKIRACSGQKGNHALVLWIVAASPWLQRITRACWNNQVHQSSRVLWPKSTCASQPYGGSDKSSNGHRYDSMCIVNGMVNAGLSCQLIHYTHEEHDKFFELCKSFDFVIVRCNPGQIKADGGDQQKFDDGMRGLRKMGKEIWPSPDVMEKMGAKDALCKVATMNIGLEDTLAYYSPEEFSVGFKKTMAFQPRVIKQNRGSSGEGIWIIKLKAENYCANYGDRSCEDDEKLVLMEANDNHEEEHTVAEFIEFCVSGRTDKSGEWTSKGVGKYLGRWQRSRWSACGPALLSTYCGGWAALQSDRRFLDRSHSQETEGGRNLCSWRNRFHLHLLRTRGTTLQEFDGKLPEDRLAPCDACLGLGSGANSTLVDYWLHPCLSSRNPNWAGEVDCGGVQLLLRGHLAVLGRLLQGRHPQCQLGRHLRGRQGRGQEDGRPHGREGTQDSFQVKPVEADMSHQLHPALKV